VQPAAHPAKFSAPILVAITDLLHEFGPEWGLVLDPFAGVGLVHSLPYTTVGVEIEPEWAATHPDTICYDSCQLSDLFMASTFDAVVTSPTYGNRMADHFDAKDESKRNTYRHTLGRPLAPNSSGRLQWTNPDYQRLHLRVWEQVRTILKPEGVFVLNVSNHIRNGKEMDVTGWHVDTLISLGFEELKRVEVETRRQKFGANANLRVDHESVIAFRNMKESDE
jgi:hypothetical protein